MADSSNLSIIGQATSLSGIVLAEGADGSVRQLQAGDGLLAGDLISTSEGMALFQFSDGSRRGLASNSSLKLGSSPNDSSTIAELSEATWSKDAQFTDEAFAAAQGVGYVLSSTETIIARSPDGSERELVIGDTIFVDEVLVAREGEAAILQMRDGIRKGLTSASKVSVADMVGLSSSAASSRAEQAQQEESGMSGSLSEFAPNEDSGVSANNQSSETHSARSDSVAPEVEYADHPRAIYLERGNASSPEAGFDLGNGEASKNFVSPFDYGTEGLGGSIGKSVLESVAGTTAEAVLKTVSGVPRGLGVALASQPEGLPLKMNQLAIGRGQSKVLTTGELSVTGFDTADPARLVFEISGLEGGRFNLVGRGDEAVTRFTQQDIDQGRVIFIHDGGSEPPAYQVSVSDGATALQPVPASVTMHDLPEPADETLTESGALGPDVGLEIEVGDLDDGASSTDMSGSTGTDSSIDLPEPADETLTESDALGPDAGLETEVGNLDDGASSTDMSGSTGTDSPIDLPGPADETLSESDAVGSDAGLETEVGDLDDGLSSSDMSGSTGTDSPIDLPDAVDDVVYVTEGEGALRDSSGVSLMSTNVILDNGLDTNEGAVKVTRVGATDVTETGDTAIAGRFGTLTIDADGDYRYQAATAIDHTPDGGVDGSIGEVDGEIRVDRFKYEISDGEGGKDTAFIDVRVVDTNPTIENVQNATMSGDVGTLTGQFDFNYGSDGMQVGPDASRGLTELTGSPPPGVDYVYADGTGTDGRYFKQIEATFIESSQKSGTLFVLKVFEDGEYSFDLQSKNTGSVDVTSSNFQQPGNVAYDIASLENEGIDILLTAEDNGVMGTANVSTNGIGVNEQDIRVGQSLIATFSNSIEVDADGKVVDQSGNPVDETVIRDFVVDSAEGLGRLDDMFVAISQARRFGSDQAGNEDAVSFDLVVYDADGNAQVVASGSYVPDANNGFAVADHIDETTILDGWSRESGFEEIRIGLDVRSNSSPTFDVVFFQLFSETLAEDLDLTFDLAIADQDGDTASSSFKVLVAGDGISETSPSDLIIASDEASVAANVAELSDEAAVSSASGVIPVSGSSFEPGMGQGPQFGSASFDNTTGEWSYVLDNGNETVDALQSGDTLTDHFSVSTVDGAAHVVSITVYGSNDAPQVGPSTVAEPKFKDAANQITITSADLLNGLGLQADPEGDAIEVIAIRPVSASDDLVETSPGVWTYYAGDFVGEQAFNFVVKDGQGGYANGVANVTIGTVEESATLLTTSGAESGAGGTLAAGFESANDPVADNVVEIDLSSDPARNVVRLSHAAESGSTDLFRISGFDSVSGDPQSDAQAPLVPDSMNIHDLLVAQDPAFDFISETALEAELVTYLAQHLEVSQSGPEVTGGARSVKIDVIDDGLKTVGSILVHDMDIAGMAGGTASSGASTVEIIQGMLDSGTLDVH